MTRKLTPAQVDDLVRDYQAGKTRDDLLRKYGIGGTQFYRLLHARGVQTVNRRYHPDLPVAEIVQRYESGESEKALADAYGVSRSAIRKRLLEAGIDPRDPTAANRLMMAERTPEENARNVAAAHSAARGRKTSWETLCRTAQTREALGVVTSAYERQMADWLAGRGIACIPQKAIGPYNADLACHPVAVEIFGGLWHGHGTHATRARKRMDYFLDCGWSVIVVWVDLNNHPLTVAAADDVISFLEEARRDPSPRGQYRMIWGDGQPIAANGRDVNHMPLKPSLA